jgi:NADH-quinone oxidoreductase subunit F
MTQSNRTPLTPVITEHWDDPESFKLANYEKHGGYTAIRTALNSDPDDVIQTLKDSGLRGRGGAGFPTGLKWGFVPQGDGNPHYLVVNADESEPGACKDIPIMLANPHALIEGIVIASWAIRANHAFVYVRGEVPHPIRRLEAAIAEAEAAGYVGENILGSGLDLKVIVHAGAGAYICGEETALLDSLEGKRGQPRLKPPFPAVAGLYACPSVVNNVETITSVPYIIKNGVSWFRGMGTEKSPGFKVFGISGHVKRPGIYEAPLGITMRELLDYAGGIRDGHELKFWLPGGSSVPLLLEEHLDTPMTYEALAEAGSMMGTGTPMVFDETTSVVKTIARWLEFYKHESCGKCTPCREGTYWISGALDQFTAGVGDPEMLDGITEICGNIFGRSFCALGDAAATPYPAALKYFRDEFEAALTQSADAAFDPAATMVIPTAGTTSGGAAS